MKLISKKIFLIFIFFSLTLIGFLLEDQKLALADPLESFMEAYNDEEAVNDYLRSEDEESIFEKGTEAVSDLVRGGILQLLKIPLSGVIVGCLVLMHIIWVLYEHLGLPLVANFLTADYYSETLGGYYSNPFVQQGWNLVVYIADAFFIITLLFIGVGTMLRIEKYNYKKLLVKLIIVALLTNFSGVFAGLIIDFFNVLMFSLAPPDFTAVETFVEQAIGQSVYTISRFWAAMFISGTKALTIAANFVLATLVIFSIAFTTIAIGILLLIRTVMLWILIVLSPLAFAAMAHPDTASIAQKWWTTFLKYCILGPMMMFFLWFSTLAINNLVFNIEGQVQTENVKEFFTTDLNPFSANMDNNAYANSDLWIKLIFIIALSWAALIAANQVGTIGASFMIRTGQIMGAAIAVGSYYVGKGTIKGGLKGARKFAEDPGAIGRLPQTLANYGENLKTQFQTMRESTKGMTKTQKFSKVTKGLELGADMTDVIGYGRAQWEKWKRKKEESKYESYEKFKFGYGTLGAVLSGKSGETMKRKISDLQAARSRQENNLTDEEIHQQAAKVVTEPLKKAYYPDSEMVQKTEDAMKAAKNAGQTEPEQLEKMASNATSDDERGAAMLMGMENGSIKEVLKGLGQQGNADGLKNVLNQMPPRFALLLAHQLQKTAKQTNNLPFEKILGLDRGNKLTFADNSQRKEFYENTLNGMSSAMVARKVDSSAFSDPILMREMMKKIKELKDNNPKQIKLMSRNGIEAMDDAKNFMSGAEKTIANEVITEWKKHHP